MRPSRQLFALVYVVGAFVVCPPATGRAQPAGEEDVVTPPVLLESPNPPWPGPPQAEDRTVVLIIVVDETGRVVEAEPVDQLPAELARAAVETVKGWRFEPARAGGATTSARIRVETTFLGVPAEPEPSPADETETPPPPPVTSTSVPPEPRGRSPIDVTVEGQRSLPPPTSAGDYQIDPGQLRDVPRRRAEQMLTLAPGFFLSNHGGEGHPSSIFLRGFDAGEGQDIRFQVDGVLINEPSNAHSHGYADTNFVIPELIRTLRVLEGPFDPRQGDFAVAGSVDYDLGLEERGVILHGAYGSFNRRRVLGLWGPGGTTERTFAGFDLQAGDGFGPNRNWSSARAMGQYELLASEDLHILFGAQGHIGEFDGAGVLREDDFEARRNPNCEPDADSQFFCFYDPNQGGKVTRVSANLRLEYDRPDYALRQQIYGVYRRNRLRENFTGFVTDVATDGPQRGDGIAQQTRGFIFGAKGSFAYNIDWLDHRHTTEIGYEVRHDEGDATQRRLRRFGGEPYATDFENGLSNTTIGGYVAGKLRPFDWLTLQGGARVDAFSFAVEDRNRPEVDRDGERVPVQITEAFGFALQPRASVQFQPWRPLTILFSYGMGARSSDAAALSDGEFAPFARVNAFETGVAYLAGDADGMNVDSRIIGFLTKVDRDLVFDPNAGRNLLIGASNRFGGVLSSRLRSGRGVDLQGSLTYADAYLPDEDAGFFDLTSGLRLPFIPRWVARIDASARRGISLFGEGFTFTLASGLSYVAPIPLPLGQLGEPIYLMDATAKARWRFLEVGVEGTNLFDRRNRAGQYNYPSNFVSPTAPASQLAAEHFAAGAPLQVLGTLTLHFETPLENRDASL